VFILQKLLLCCQIGNMYCLVSLFSGISRTSYVCWPLSCSRLTCLYCKRCVWRLFIKVELLSCPSWLVKDLRNTDVKQKLQATVFLELSVTWCYVVFVKAVWPIFGHADAVRRRVLTLVIHVHFQQNSGGICGRQSNAGTDLFPNILILSC
jgi:hypothetical protein